MGVSIGGTLGEVHQHHALTAGALHFGRLVGSRDHLDHKPRSCRRRARLRRVRRTNSCLHARRSSPDGPRRDKPGGPTVPETVVLIPAYFLPLPRTTVPAYGATVLATTVVTQGVTWFRVDYFGPSIAC